MQQQVHRDPLPEAGRRHEVTRPRAVQALLDLASAAIDAPNAQTAQLPGEAVTVLLITRLAIQLLELDPANQRHRQAGSRSLPRPPQAEIIEFLPDSGRPRRLVHRRNRWESGRHRQPGGLLPTPVWSVNGQVVVALAQLS
jgi:hypothetical protein